MKRRAKESKLERKETERSKDIMGKEKGITLIALVVTIVVLLILAGVSISLVLGNNGIINKAKEARDKYAQAIENDQIELGELENMLKSNLSNSIDIEEPGDIEDPGDDDKILPSSPETTPYFPSVDFSQVDGTDLTNGLVIEDPDGNQYVWVEVPRTAEVYPIAGLAITNFTDEEYTKIENDLHTYTNTYRNGTNFTDTYYEDSTTGWFKNATEYNIAKNKMLKSVYQNGGFWIGRYEGGFGKARNNQDEAITNITKPLSKANLYPINYVTRTQAKVLAEKVLGTSGERTSSLMYGVQWDLVLKYIETKKVAKGTELATIQSILRSDSTTIGNYSDNLWNITNTLAKYSTDKGIDWSPCPKNKENSESILLTTGADTSFGLMNIYDIAGNVYEWTLEKTSSAAAHCTGRGGTYGNNGSEYPATYRYYDLSTDSGSSNGFRVSLY